MAIEKNLRIIVICGGVSTEREVSLRSGKAIYDALVRKGYHNVELFDNCSLNCSIFSSGSDIISSKSFDTLQTIIFLK